MTKILIWTGLFIPSAMSLQPPKMYIFINCLESLIQGENKRKKQF